MNSVIRKKKKFRRRAWSMFFLLLLMTVGGSFYYISSRLPDRLHIASIEDAEDIRMPFEGIVQEEVVKASVSGSSNIPHGTVRIECRILGILPVKTVEVQEKIPQKVIPCGNTVGIFMRTKGILVVGTGIVGGIDGLDYEPARGIVQSGDYITGVNGEPVSTKEELVACVNESGGEQLQLTVRRDGEETDIQVIPVCTGKEEYKLGVWVRDDTQGIGTLTYVDEENHYGALGHGISDVDTGMLMDIQDGKLYRAEVQAVKKGEKGVPGELSGVIRYQEDQVAGTITENRDTGISGRLNALPDNLYSQEAVEIAYRQEVEEGAAVIRCAVDGVVKEYDIEIQKINLSHSDVNKSMVLKVTDSELLEKTGGIVQGMSGSPILQNGKLVGAVTHVFIADPARGYGIFIENMLEH